MEIQGYKKNPELAVPLISRLSWVFQETSDVTWPEQRAIYHNLGARFKGKRILDVGCGLGFGTYTMACQGARVVGLDIDPAHAIFASKIYPNFTFHVWDMKQGPVEPPGEIVVSVEVIEHIDDPETVIRNMLASATEYVIFSCPNRRNPNLGSDQPLNPHHVAEYLPEEVLEYLIPFGHEVAVLSWDELKPVHIGTDMSPLVYEVKI